MPEKNRTKTVRELREQAEKKARERSQDFRKPESADVRGLFHELEVHQIELEIQNEELERVQLELHESRDRYLNLYEYAPVGYFTLDRNGRILEANLTGAVTLGKPRGRLLKTDFTRFVAPESQDTFYFHLGKVLETSQRQNCELRIKKQDGSLIDVLVSSIARADAFGQISQCFSTVTDVTIEKQSEALKESEKKYRDQFALLKSIIESPNTPIFSIDNDYRYTSFNSSHAAVMRSLYGVDIEIGKSLVDYMKVAEDHETARQNLDRVLKGEYLIEEAYSGEESLERSYFRVYHSPVKSIDNTINGAVVFAQDLTERKQAEEALRQSEERYRNLFESMDEGFALCEMIYDKAGKPVDFSYLAVNPAFTTLTGLPAEQVEGHTVKELIPGIEPLWLETYTRVVQSGISERIDNPVAALGKHYEVYAWRSGIGRFACVFNDVTERMRINKALHEAKDELEVRVRERTAELSQANKRLKYYIAEIIRAQEKERKRIALELHDDTSPSLAYLALELDAIARKYPELQVEIIERLSQLREKITGTQKDIRQFSHELHPAVLENLGLEAALETLASDTSSKGQVNVEFGATGTERSLSDEAELTVFRIAQEALNNVQKHSGAAAAKISLKYTLRKIKLSITDNGKGFDINAGRKPGAKGGLGLIGMQERAQLVGADLKIKSIIGKGTVLALEVPYKNKKA